jgi:DNA (cytosine-5)-methyltransferase 1
MNSELEYDGKTDDLTLVSLFCGAGGMDIGFRKAGFRTVWANEYDKAIASSYRHYFPEVKFDARSILDIPCEDIPRGAAGIIGGPPCQSWSEAGAKRGIDDPRGKLFYEYMRVLKHVRPKFFVAENVSGMLAERNAKPLRNIVAMFDGEGYSVICKMLKASDYGVPQDRERVFIVGYDSDFFGGAFWFPDPQRGKVTLRDAIGDLEGLEVGKTDVVKNHETIRSGYSSMFMSRNRVRGWNEQSFTILATARHAPLHPGAPKMVKVEKDKFAFVKGRESEYRRLTVRECARIQTFPDDYEFVYDRVEQGYKMVGNAVPVNMAYRIAKQIRQDWEQGRKEQERK